MNKALRQRLSTVCGKNQRTDLITELPIGGFFIPVSVTTLKPALKIDRFEFLIAAPIIVMDGLTAHNRKIREEQDKMKFCGFRINK
jgi:hypothetical protein